MKNDLRFVYNSQTDNFYEVETPYGEKLRILKNRQPTSKYPPKRSKELMTMYKWLRISALGLLTSGVLTLISFYPIIQSYSNVPLYEKSKAKSILITSLILFAFALMTVVILIVHIIY